MTTLRTALKGAAIALALVGTAIAATGSASAQTVYYGNDPYAGSYNGQGGYYNNDPYSSDYRNGYNRDGYGYNRDGDGRYGYGRDRTANAFSLLLATIAFGYRDGYWDRRHHWHHWRHSSDYQYYRDHGSNYYGYNHDRYDNNGWQPY